jgi:tRNA(fMet)-specific endonuclease VapC
VPDYLLDTNIVSYWYDTGRPEHKKVLARVQAVRIPDTQTNYVPHLFVSAVTIGEIVYGHRVTASPDASKQSEFEAFIREQCPQPIEISKHVGEPYGELRAWLFRNFVDKSKRAKTKWPEELVDPTTAKELGVQENDIWIAAQAMTHNFVLVTHDSRDRFRQLLHQFRATLQVEDWAM